MNCHIIFYMARKTGLCEKALHNSLESVKLKPQKTLFATNPRQFGENITSSLAEINLVFTIGGLYSADSQGIENILSSALSNRPPQEVKRLRNNISDYDGYIIRQDCQLIVVLPDEPEEITEFFKGPLNRYLQDFTEKPK